MKPTEEQKKAYAMAKAEILLKKYNVLEKAQKDRLKTENDKLKNITPKK